MSPSYRPVLSSGFKRDLRLLTQKNEALLEDTKHALSILETDPLNLSRQYQITKLKGLKAGQGQWRIRVGGYRIRYDVIGQDVLLHSFKDRKDVYK